MNKTPKLLPWLARKAGISIEKATVLWSEVVSDTSLQAAGAKDPDGYYRLIVERFQDLTERDKPAAKPAGAPHSPLLVLSSHGGASSAILLNPFGLKIA
ncbi:MAG TPA: hypothetical protein VGE12_06295 [Noviherbaspirillum sp.]